jgi:hypothetical protein
VSLQYQGDVKITPQYTKEKEFKPTRGGCHGAAWRRRDSVERRHR